jgi:hypothetical protein
VGHQLALVEILLRRQDEADQHLVEAEVVVALGREVV